MKNTFQIIGLLFCFGFFAAGCKEYTNLVPNIQGTPGGGVTKTQVASVQGNELTFEVNLFCVNHVGNFIENLASNDFSADPVTGVDISIVSSEYTQQDYQGNYSVGMLFDQSASISTTDPNDARVVAGKAFVDLMDKNDEMALAQFPGSTSGSFSLLSNFTNDRQSLKSLIDGFIGTVGGNTPLYSGMYSMIDHIGANASNNDNQALVAFTDGADNASSVSPSSVIARAQAKNVVVFTIGLNLSNYVDLQHIALETGGAVMQADDALQLISLYQSLGELLEGTAYYYSTVWKATRSNGQPWVSGNILNTSIVATLPSGDQINLPLYVRIP